LYGIFKKAQANVGELNVKNNKYLIHTG